MVIIRFDPGNTFPFIFKKPHFIYYVKSILKFKESSREKQKKKTFLNLKIVHVKRNVSNVIYCVNNFLIRSNYPNIFLELYP